MRFSCFIMLLCTVYCRAQTLSFETLTTAKGLSNNEVTCIYEDSKGFLWIGTKDGLNKFDGRVFKIYRNNSADSNSVSGNYIDDIIEDKQHIFWIATKDGGLTRFDENAPADNQFRQFRNNPDDSTSIATNRLNCLYDWDENYLLIGGEMGPAIFINKKNFRFSYSLPQTKFLPAFATSQPRSTDWIQSFQKLNDSIFYFSTLLNSQIIRVNKITGVAENLHDAGADLLSVKQFIVSNNKIWIACWKPGLFVMKDTICSNDTKFTPIDDLLMWLCDYDSTYLLAGTRSSGLFLVNKFTGTMQVFTKNIFHKHGLPSNKINCIYRDSKNIFWIGTSAGLAMYNTGIWAFDEKEFAGPELDCTNFNSYRFDDGSIAVNTSNGMFLSDPARQEFRKIVFTSNGNTIVPDCLFRMNGQNFALGTEIGFYSWQKNADALGELTRDEKLKLPWSKIFSSYGVYQVKQFLPDTVNAGQFLIMPVVGYGLGIFNTGNGELKSFIHNPSAARTSLASNITRRVAKDRKGNIWVASAGGLSKWPAENIPVKNDFINYVHEMHNPNSLPVNDLTDVWCDENDHVWITMSGGGLCEFDGRDFRQYLPASSISSHFFLGMYADHNRRIWCITKNGIEVFDRVQKKFYHLDINEGSANNYLDPYFSNLNQGRISFTSGNRIFTFNPDSFKFNEQFPEPYLADMNVIGKDYLFAALHGPVELNPRQRFVNFSVSALQFTSPSSVRFQYRLDGLEDNWNNSDNGEIKYTNLPWGYNYRLLVKVSNPSGQFGPEKMLARFAIATPFYASWWFILLCIFCVAGLAFAAYRYRVNQLIALQKVRNKIARDLHDDIGSALGGISFLSEAAKQQLQQSNVAGAEKMLGKIGHNSRETVENISDIVWSVNPKNDSAKYLIDRMRVFATDLVAASEIKIQFDHHPGIEHVKLSMEQRKNIFLIFKEAIYNSVKYSGCKNIIININKTSGGLQVTIKDDGSGFDLNNYVSKNGNGIPNMRLRASEINCDFSIKSGADGAHITISV